MKSSIDLLFCVATLTNCYNIIQCTYGNCIGREFLCGLHKYRLRVDVGLVLKSARLVFTTETIEQKNSYTAECLRIKESSYTLHRLQTRVQLYQI